MVRPAGFFFARIRCPLGPLPSFLPSLPVARPPRTPNVISLCAAHVRDLTQAPATVCHKLPLPLLRFITIPQSSISHTEFGIRKLEMLMPRYLIMERDRVGQSSMGFMERQNGAVSALRFPAPRTPLTLRRVHPTPPTPPRPLSDQLRGIPIPLPNHHSAPPHLRTVHFATCKFRNPESGVLKNCRRARGVLKRPRSVSAMLFLTPF